MTTSRQTRLALLTVAILALAAIAGASLLRRAGMQASNPAPGNPPDWSPIDVRPLSHGRFDNFNVYAPHGTPRGFVVLLSGPGGWNSVMSDMANRLALRGAMVAGIDLAGLSAKLESDGAGCVFPDGDLENLSHFVQAYFRLPTYLPPLVAGIDEGAALAYATLAQAPANTFAGAVSLGFCPTLSLRKPLCKSGALDYSPLPGGGVALLPAPALSNPWWVLEGSAAPQGCDAAVAAAFVAHVGNVQRVAVPGPGAADPAAAAWIRAYTDTFDGILARNAPAAGSLAPQALADLPIVPVAALPGAPPTDTFAIMLSGDGGWAGLDKDVAAALTADGITVVGLDSLRYFWSARTPEGLAADLDRMIRYYLTELGKQRVVLIGYSQGADVLPFAVNRLTPETRAHVALTAVMGMSEHALFEFHMTSWVSDDDSGPATLPEVARIGGIPVLCIYGEDESDTLCPKLDPHKATVVKLKGGHHFDGNYAALARTILSAAGR